MLLNLRNKQGYTELDDIIALLEVIEMKGSINIQKLLVLCNTVIACR
jgi:hypothetical protein